MNKFNTLQVQEISKEDISKLKFTDIIYKTVSQIIAQPYKTNLEKLDKWNKVQRKYKGLVDIKFDGGLGIVEARKKEGYNKTIDEEKESFAECILSVLENEAKGNYKVLYSVKFGPGTTKDKLLK